MIERDGSRTSFTTLLSGQNSVKSVASGEVLKVNGLKHITENEVVVGKVSHKIVRIKRKDLDFTQQAIKVQNVALKNE